MKLNFLKSIFKENKKRLKLPESILIKNIKKLNTLENIYIFENITIHNFSKKVFIPLLILDSSRGIYLFEYKEWSYNDLKDASISKAESTNQESSKEGLAFQKLHQFINQKLTKLSLDKEIPIFNFLLMQNLNADEYEHLDLTFKKLLPKNRIIFNDMEIDDISDKLNSTIEANSELYDAKNILSSLLGQYTIIKDDGGVEICSDEQIEFIEDDIDSVTVLSTPPASGKTSSILLKAITQKIKNENQKIIIIQNTPFATQKLRKRLLQTLDMGEIDIKSDDIEILTPLDLVNKHLKKINKLPLEVVLHIDKKLMKSGFNVADLILCDDTNLISKEFIEYLKHIQKKSSLILVQNYFDKTDNATTYHLSKNFRADKQKVIFKKSNPHAKALQLISKLLENHKANDILVISDNLRKKRLAEDLEFFIEDNTILLDSSKTPQEEDLVGLMLLSYSQVASMEAKFVILLDSCTSSTNEVNYAVSLSTDTTYIVYEKETDDIKELRISFEDK